MKSNTLVAIFPRPAPHFRVRELGTSGEVSTVKWASDYDEALAYVDEHYSANEMRSPEDFKAEVLSRRGTPC